MSKQVIMTEAVKQAIKNGLGDTQAPVDTFAVYEARFLSTEPLSKGGIFNKATVSVSTLKDMETSLNKEGGAIPLHIMHEDHLLPVGKVFKARLQSLPNGHMELIGQFYLPKSQVELIDKLETSVVDEVSVGILTQHAFCSECNFDFFGENSSIMNFINLTCDQGHQIGVDGVHARLVGLQSWDELSLVGRGAANQAKILPRAKHNMSKDTVEKLAANGQPERTLVLTASNKIGEPTILQTTQGVESMDQYQALLSKYEANISLVAKSEMELTAAKTEVTKLAAEVEALKASAVTADEKIKALEASKTQDLVALEASAKDANEKINAAVEKLTPHVKAALVASGVAETDIPTDLTAMVGMIEEKGLKLHQVVSAEATASGAKSDDVVLSASDSRRKEAFKLSNKSK